ncbi:MAG: alpha/beta fold hydrolase [Acidimicrobiia bacterium]|nr:alpha/beta fold hydrolase [Acidimicrobiia bacterium]
MTELMHPLAEAFRHDGSNGEAVVIIHGFTGNPAQFRPLGEALNTAGYTVIAPRLAGHGTSREDMATTGARDWIASARAAYDEVVADHDAVHLVGLSMGGLISILLARHLPVASVTTINSPVLVRDPRSYLAPFLARWVPAIEWADSGPPDVDEDMLPYWVTYDGFSTEKLGDLHAILFGAVSWARYVRAPLLVIQSKTDETVHPVSARILDGAFGGDSRVVWLERSMHNALIDRERDVIESAILAHMGGA